MGIEEHYDAFRRPRLKEQWYVRGRLRAVFLGDRIGAIDRVLADSELVEAGRERTLRRAEVDGAPYLLKVYRASGLRARRVKRRALDQLERGIQAVGLGLDVVVVEGACVAPPRVVLFLPEQIGWGNLSTFVNGQGADASAKRRVLGAFAAFLRRLHDAGFDHPGLRFRHFQVRVRSRSQDFQLAELEDVRFVNLLRVDRQIDMLRRLMADFRGGDQDALRFLQAYTEDEDVAREIAPLVLQRGTPGRSFSVPQMGH